MVISLKALGHRFKVYLRRMKNPEVTTLSCLMSLLFPELFSECLLWTKGDYGQSVQPLCSRMSSGVL